MSVPRKRVSKLHAPTSTPDNFPPHSTLLKRSGGIKDLKSRLGQQKFQNHCKGGPEGHHGIDSVQLSKRCANSFSPPTSVSRCFRPWKRKVNFSWSKPSNLRIVAWRSLTWIRSSTARKPNSSVAPMILPPRMPPPASQVVLFQFGQDKGVDGIFRPSFARWDWRHRRVNGLKRPKFSRISGTGFCPGRRPTGNPAAESDCGEQHKSGAEPEVKGSRPRRGRQPAPIVWRGDLRSRKRLAGGRMTPHKIETRSRKQINHGQKTATLSAG